VLAISASILNPLTSLMGVCGIDFVCMLEPSRHWGYSALRMVLVGVGLTELTYS
jgi:hypothetical protein